MLNAVGDDRMQDGKGVREALGRGGEVATMPAGATGPAGEGSGVEASWSEAMDTLTRTMDHLSSTLENDGYHLQRASLEIDEAMNECSPGGSAGPAAV
ncbi:hypothetical protein BJF86_10490 [Serinicoccus sp. CNJ-927]|nr:hypothetical protein BJF86_10490 [Serinicoccus sp. CNJ-927]